MESSCKDNAASVPPQTEGSTFTVPSAPLEFKPEDAVTPEILSAILENLNRPELELVDFEAKPGTLRGENYMSLMYAVKINLKDKVTGKSEVLPVMLKVLPRNELRVKRIIEENIFVRDVKFYQEIIPAMENFQTEIAQLPEKDIQRPWPKCYSSKTDGKNDYLAMEDLKTKGFRMANRQLGLDFDHCKLVLEYLARFHAVSFAMFQGNFEKILERYPYLDEVMFREEKIPQDFKEVINQTYVHLAVMLREAGEELGASLLEKIYTVNYFQDLYKIVGANVKWAVIGHGDSWTNNLLFRYDEETSKPIEVKFVDYQNCRASSRAVDIHYFLYSSPTTQILNEREEELEQIYFDEFSRFAKKLNINLEDLELTKENFDKEIESVRYYGVLGGFMLSLVVSADAEDVPVMEDVSEEDLENMKNSGENFFLKMMKEKAMQKIKNLAGVHLPRCPQTQNLL